VKKLVLAFLSTLLCLNLFCVQPANAVEYGNLTPCSKSAGFEKRLKASVKKLNDRLAKYEQGSLPYLALEKQIDQTKTRFKQYADGGLLCGADGLPHLIADGDFTHAGEFIIPGIGFIYTTGWIGWAGRSYLQVSKKSDKATEMEIIIDVPLAIKMMVSAYAWPAAAWIEFTSGKLLAAKNDITVSPR
jgi:photosystem I subunit 3